MSRIVKPLKLDYLDIEGKKSIFSADIEDDFNFKYVPEDKFKHIVKHIRRQRTQNNEEREWNSFIKRQTSEKDDSSVESIHTHVIRSSHENEEKIDDKVRYKEENTFFEESYSISNNSEDDNLEQDQEKSSENILKDCNTNNSSTSALLTIPEKGNVSSCIDNSTKHKHDRQSNSKKYLKKKKNHCKTQHSKKHGSEYNSSPELSFEDSAKNKIEEFYLRPNPNTAYRILTIQKKILDVLDEIARRLNNIPSPDGERDLHRRQQRVIEFSIRFSRNYLYDLGRYITDIQRHISVISPNARVNCTKRDFLFHMNAIEQKLTNTYQLLLNALNAFCKHIPSSVLKGHPGKLKEILQMVIDLRDICVSLNLTPDYIGSGDSEEVPLEQETENKCSAILTILRLSSDNKTQLINHTATRASASMKRRSAKRVSNYPSSHAMDIRIIKSQRSKKPSSGKLLQKEKRDSHQKSVFSSFNKNYKSVPDNHPQSSTSYNSVKETVRTKITIPPKEDDIKTMMDIIASDLDNESNTESTTRINQATSRRCTGKVIQTISNRLKHVMSNKEITDDGKSDNFVDRETVKKKGLELNENNISTLIPVFNDLISLIKHKENDPTMRPIISTCLETLSQLNEDSTSYKSSKPKKNTEGKQTDTKNMQLIYLSEDSSMLVPKYNDVSCQANCDEFLKFHISSTIDETPLIISESAKMNLLDYKHVYQNSLKSSPMYSSSTQNKPWDLVVWIADKLVHELIVDIAKELELNDCLKRIFELEFQEF